MNSSLDNISTCGDDKGGEISSNKKVNTSCDQKDEHCNNDGVDHNTSSNSSSGIDTVSDCIEKIGISNDWLALLEWHGVSLRELVKDTTQDTRA